MAIVTDDNTATPAGRGADANGVERVLAAAVRGAPGSATCSMR